jgi:hypothetical protein
MSVKTDLELLHIDFQKIIYATGRNASKPTIQSDWAFVLCGHRNNEELGANLEMNLFAPKLVDFSSTNVLLTWHGKSLLVESSILAKKTGSARQGLIETQKALEQIGLNVEQFYWSFYRKKRTLPLIPIDASLKTAFLSDPLHMYSPRITLAPVFATDLLDKVRITPTPHPYQPPASEIVQTPFWHPSLTAWDWHRLVEHVSTMLATNQT